MRYLVGIGNFTMTDDSIGLRIAEAIAARGLDRKNGFEVLELGNNGLNLLSYFNEDAEAMLWVDCVKMGREPGDFLFFSPADASSRKLLAQRSTHEGDMLKVLELATKLSYQIPAIEVLGIEPFALVPGIELSERLARRFEEYLEVAVARCSAAR